MATAFKHVEESETSRFLLPREAYTSLEWYQREMEHVFGAQWYFAGMTRDVQNPGDYSCVQVGAYPMFFLRDEHGDLRAYHNICRHRGAAILEGRGNVKDGMTCFYHSWTYGLDGCLKSIPQPDEFPGLNKATLGLKPGAIETFRGLVFVHVNPDMQGSLLDWMSDFPDHFGPFDLESYVEPAGAERMEVKANWKLFIENHIDGYHLYHLHKDSMLGINHDGQLNYLYDNHWSIFEPLAEAGVLPEYEKHIPTALLVSEDEKWQASSVHMLFPNLGIATGAKWFTILQSVPTGPTTSIIESRTLLKPYADGEEEPDIKYYPGSSEGTDLMAEDRLAVERLQVALGSPNFECGPLARNLEKAVQTFHESLMAHLNR